MGTFFKVILRNIIKGPSTIKYPFEDSPAPEKLRGMIEHNPDICAACHICEYVCAGGAIKIQESGKKDGLDFVVWHNTCTFCGLCEYYCPTKAIHLTNNYHTAHLEKDKFNFCNRTFIKYEKCISCGEPLIPLPQKLSEKMHGIGEDRTDAAKLCPNCRRKSLWEGYR